MKRAANPLLRRFRGKPAILDTNLLLLDWCADFDPELIHSFKRLNSFFEKDVLLLKETLQAFSALRTTPHVLTEVSNLANSLPRWRKESWAEHFKSKIEVVPEKWIAARTIAQEPAFWLGLTDAGLCALAKSNVILTIDFPLSNYLESRRLNVINFTHLRELQ
jgi:hypothetical protein